MEVSIGHIVVTGHQDTDLAKIAGRSGRTVALPLKIPIRSAELHADTALVADQFTFRREIPYSPAPGRPKVVPVQLEIVVTDPGTISGRRIHNNGDAVSYSQQPVTFQRYEQSSRPVDEDL